MIVADCGKAWGRAKEKLCASRNIMHRNLRVAQQKCLWRNGFSSIIRIWLARAPARPIGNRRPIWRWADGKRSRRIGARLALGRVLRAMLPALHGDGGIEAGAPTPSPDRAATPASLRDGRHGAGSVRCVLRGAPRGRRSARRRECTPGGARHRARAGRKAVSRPDAAGGGREPTRSSSQGAGSGSLRGVGVPARAFRRPSLLATCGGKR
jgi:hypothetical protein